MALEIPTLEIPTFGQDKEKYYLSEPMFYSMALQLGERLNDWEAETGEKIDTVVGAPRGALEIMNLCAQFLELTGDNVQAITINTRDGEEQRTEIITGQLPEEKKIYGKVVLWADDVRDTGVTEDAGEKKLLELGAARVLRADLGYKPTKDKATPKRAPDIYIFETERWVVFPWERILEYRKAYCKLKEQGGSRSDFIQLKSNYMYAQGFSSLPVLSPGIIKL